MKFLKKHTLKPFYCQKYKIKSQHYLGLIITWIKYVSLFHDAICSFLSVIIVVKLYLFVTCQPMIKLSEGKQ